MILKVKTHPKPNCWKYFDADQVQSAPYNPGYKDLDGVDTHRFESGVNRGFVHISFYGLRNEPVEIITDIDVYLCNETGQTVEKLK